MVQTLTRDQQKVLRAFGGYQLAELLINPDNFKALGGGSSTEIFGYKAWLDYTGTYVQVSSGIGREVIAKVTWAQAKRYAKTLPANLIAQLRENQSELRQCQRDYPVWAAPKEALGCGRPVEGQPLTPAQQIYRDAYAEHVERLRPWYAEKERLEDIRNMLFNEALPGADNLCRCPALAFPHLPAEGCQEVA